MKIELNEQTRKILGTMCFQTIKIASLMRKAGYEYAPAEKAEDEQAVVIHWMLNLYFEHGENWRKIGSDQMVDWVQKIKDLETAAIIK